MERFCLLSLLLHCCFLSAQSTISVDAVAAMPVCDAQHAETSVACASAPHVLTRVDAIYPEQARRAYVQGVVVLSLVVQKDGLPRDIHTLSSPSEALSQAATDAVKQWKFDPPTYHGNPVDAEIKVEVSFRLADNPAPSIQPSPNVPKNGAGRNLHVDADEAYRREDYQTAANICRRILELAPQDAAAWNTLGRSLLALGESDAAIEAFTNSIKFYPASPVAYNNSGLAYWRQHKYDDAAAQFRKQVLINPDDHYAHANLGRMLLEEKKCDEALPELEKALVIAANNAELLVALGECDLDLGKREKGVSELEHAVGASATAHIWNAAAYVLAEHNIELDRAEKWSDASLNMHSPRLASVSLDHLTFEQLNLVAAIASYWDTRGWIYFLRGDYANAEAFLEPSWRLGLKTVIGSHLAQVYEKTGRSDLAIQTYAMAIAAASRPGRFIPLETDVADARAKLAKLDSNPDNLISKARHELEALNRISVQNTSQSAGEGDFLVLIGSDPPVARQLSGQASLHPVTSSLEATRFPIRIPKNVNVQIPVRGSLVCKSDESQCQFSLLAADAAVDLAHKEMARDTAPPPASPRDPHTFDSPVLGMRISLPDDWQVVKEEPGSFSRPHNVIFGKPGSLAMFVLTREHVEGGPDLYKKMLEAFFARESNYERKGEESVTRDGLSGTHWTMALSKENVPYMFVMEFFSIGEDHYRLTGLAPKEVYDRYAETFANIMHSVKFPMVHTDPRVLEGLK